MGELFEMASNLPKREVHEDIKQIFYFEFADGDKRREAMNVINELRDELRRTDHDIFAGLEYVEPDSKWERQYQGLELAFSTQIDGREQKILEYLHEKGISLNIKNGEEEKPYVLSPEEIGKRAA
jgi:hypothetical protein